MPKLKNHHQFWNREAKGLSLDKKNLHCGRYQEALLFPLSDIFPKLFFLKELNESWSELFHVLWDENSAKKWNQNLDHKKLEILLKSSWDYLDHHEKEAVFIFRMRTFFKEMKNDEIGLKKIVENCKELLHLADQWEKIDILATQKKSPLRSLGQSYLLFILTLNNSVYSPTHQKKILELAQTYGKKAQWEVEESAMEDHPYFGLLFCLLHVAKGEWDKATQTLHKLSQRYPDPRFYQVLMKLYIKIDLPNVAYYFEKKLKASQTSQRSAEEDSSFGLDLNSDLRDLANAA